MFWRVVIPGHVSKLFGHNYDRSKKRWSDTLVVVKTSQDKAKLTLNLGIGKVTIPIITYFNTLISTNWVIFN